MNALFLALAAPEVQQDVFGRSFELFRLGGPVMWPILFVSLMGLTVAFERLFAIWKYNTANVYFRKTQQTVFELTREGRFQEAAAAAAKGDSPVCRILAQALGNRELGFQETLEAASQLEINSLRRGLSVLDTCITVAPMLGILGTVTGIINTFNLLSAVGIDDPHKATAGLAEALITTAAGLIVAIGCLFPFNYLVSQVKRRTTELEQIIHHFEIAFNTGTAKTAQAHPVRPETQPSAEASCSRESPRKE